MAFNSNTHINTIVHMVSLAELTIATAAPTTMSNTKATKFVSNSFLVKTEWWKHERNFHKNRKEKNHTKTIRFPRLDLIPSIA